MAERAYCNWSSGKDAALALHEAMTSGDYEVLELFTVIRQDGGRVSMHEVGRELVQRQADSIGLPLHCFPLDLRAPAAYQTAMAREMAGFYARGITTAIFGDICLEALRESREKRCAESGMRTAFPLWGQEPDILLERFLSLGFRAVITCVDAAVLDESFLGKVIDRDLLARFPPGVNLCGENGEYHSFVFDGPIFREPVPFRLGRRYYKDFSGRKGMERFWYVEIE